MRLAIAQNEKGELQKQLKAAEQQIENLPGCVVDATSASGVSACEVRIEKLKRQKLVLVERVEKTVPPKGRLEDCIELALKFFSSPWN